MIKALIAFVVVTTVACGPDAREKALRSSLTALNTARDGFVVWDKNKQTQIVDSATTYEDGVVALDTYYKDRSVVLESFEIAYRALAIAAYSPTAANALQVYAHIMDLWDRIKSLTGKRPNDPPPPQ